MSNLPKGSPELLLRLPLEFSDIKILQNPPTHILSFAHLVIGNSFDYDL